MNTSGRSPQRISLAGAPAIASRQTGLAWGRALTCVAVLLALLAGAGCSKLKARDQLNKGVQSYKNARYEEAIEHFKNAVSLDPELLNARLYLATAYAQRYIPGAETEENKRMGVSAIEEYKRVLTRDTGNLNAIKGIAYLYLQMKDMEQAKQYYAKAAAADPNDPENYYSVAVIDWTQAYRVRQEERLKLNMKPSEPLKDKKVCALVKSANQQPVEDGILMLQKALKIRPDYDDAMVYMNLLHRERADYQCDDPAARTADMKTADDWLDKQLATKRAKMQKTGPGGIVLPPAPASQDGAKPQDSAKQ